MVAEQAPQTDAERVGDEATRPSVRAWIETRDGWIARGVVALLSEDGALLQLTMPLPVRPGADVTVRLSFNPTSATLGLGARVLWFRANGADSACEVKWLPGTAAAQLGPQVRAFGPV